MVLIIYDLETTGFITRNRHPSICQIGAVSSTGSEFCEFCMPEQAIEPGASEATGFKIDRHGNLSRNGRALETNSVASVLRQFMIWIEAQTSANNNSRNRNRRASTNVILVAHNGNKFDHPILQRACEEHGVSFPRCRISFVDSIPLLKSAIPGRREMSLPSLVRDLLPEMDFQGHDALNDATALKELIDSQIGDEEDVERALGL